MSQTFSAFSPLEQFSVQKLISFNVSFVDISLTNSALYCLFTLATLYGVLSLIYHNGGLTLPSHYQSASEMIYQFVSGLVAEQLSARAKGYICIVVTTFLYILTANLLGLIPFSFATTAQLIVAFSLSSSLFIGVTLIGVLRHGLHFLSFFLPSGVPLGLVPLMVLIELVSYIFRPISLGIRLFANITAGHSLLAVIAGFGWNLAAAGSYFILLSFVPMIVIIAIYGLELAVAFLQAYVFSVLLCIYLKDAIELH